MKNSFIQVQCSVPTKKVAKKLAKILVERRLSACVNIVPKITSVYIYEGEFCEDEELLLLIKTDTQHFTAVQQCILELHPYDIAEIIVLPIDKMTKAYKQWFMKALS